MSERRRDLDPPPPPWIGPPDETFSTVLGVILAFILPFVLIFMVISRPERFRKVVRLLVPIALAYGLLITFLIGAAIFHAVFGDASKWQLPSWLNLGTLKLYGLRVGVSAVLLCAAAYILFETLRYYFYMPPEYILLYNPPPYKRCTRPQIKEMRAHLARIGRREEEILEFEGVRHLRRLTQAEACWLIKRLKSGASFEHDFWDRPRSRIF